MTVCIHNSLEFPGISLFFYVDRRRLQVIAVACSGLEHGLEWSLDSLLSHYLPVLMGFVKGATCCSSRSFQIAASFAAVTPQRLRTHTHRPQLLCPLRQRPYHLPLRHRFQAALTSRHSHRRHSLHLRKRPHRQSHRHPRRRSPHHPHLQLPSPVQPIAAHPSVP